jgi:hypothetical protein
MKKEDWISLLRLTGVGQDAITLAVHGYEIGFEEAKHETIRQSPIIKREESSENKETGDR